jgi:transposase-like protein
VLPFLASASAAAIVGLRCPHCAHVQARARGEAGAKYACKACGREFTLEQGTIPAPFDVKR